MSGLPFPLTTADGEQRELLLVRLMGNGSTSDRLAALTAAQAFDNLEVVGYFSEHPYVTDGPLEPFTVVIELDWRKPHDADVIAHAIAQELEHNGATLLSYTRTYRVDAAIMDGHTSAEARNAFGDGRPSERSRPDRETTTST